MQIKPQSWTHHHTHRLFHISLGLCFGFISLVIVGGMATALFSATADTSPKSGVINVGATVEGVNPGPINPGGQSGTIIPPVQTQNPTVTIVAEPQGYVPTQGGAYVFNNQTPAFSGVSSVPNGLVFITIRGAAELNSTAQADSLGHWYWQSPVYFPEGKYDITVAVFDSYDLTRSGSAKANFIIKLPEGQQPVPVNPGSSPTEPQIPSGPLTPPTGPTSNLIFGAFIKILPDYKVVETTQKVVVAVNLISNSGKEVLNQDIHFKIVSPQGKVILQTSDVVSFNRHSEYLKTFYIAPATPEGEYTISVSADYTGTQSLASDTFTIKEFVVLPTGQTTPNSNTIEQWPAMIWALLLMLLLLFIVLTIMAYHQIRHHSREIYAEPENQA